MIFSGKVKHIHIPVPDRLIHMTAFRYHEMIRKYRIRINQNMIFLALTTLELHHYLFFRAVFTTEEAATLGNILLAEFCCGRHHPGRVELELYVQTANLNLLDAHILQRPEIITGQRPTRELVSYELMYSIFFHLTSSTLHTTLHELPAPMYGHGPYTDCLRLPFLHPRLRPNFPPSGGNNKEHHRFFRFCILC